MYCCSPLQISPSFEAPASCSLLCLWVSDKGHGFKNIWWLHTCCDNRIGHEESRWWRELFRLIFSPLQAPSVCQVWWRLDDIRSLSNWSVRRASNEKKGHNGFYVTSSNCRYIPIHIMECVLNGSRVTSFSCRYVPINLMTCILSPFF